MQRVLERQKRSGICKAAQDVLSRTRAAATMRLACDALTDTSLTLQDKWELLPAFLQVKGLVKQQ
jgi:hypothetical protein